ncbi:hypothetical protein CAPTEDRAFT_220559 [Capitella teleta]|uniref:Cytochrome P450 n=2 Tax=Capitella teleta TaxID=283909 RepID=R7V6N3_CAPTE|nr:hypothetical protein CAPTEDRAFT_220559 [Capitella teleta]|eukprot:ELU14194.1 hypothetical protein CAPTEDRAFT_220559 [Capitella teleta]
MWIPTALAGVAVLMVFAIYRDRKKKHNIFRKLGIPGPEPHWWYGNLKQLRSQTRLAHESLDEWSRVYGTTYGYYEGPTAILVTSDLNFLKSVFIKNFNKFHARKYFPLQPNPVTHPVCSMVVAEGQRWKRLRNISNPSFTSSKLKHATKMMNQKSEKLLQKLEELTKKGEVCNIQPFLQGLAMDVLGEAAFGIDLNAQGDTHTPLLSAIRKFVQQNGFQFEFMAVVPELRFRVFDVLFYLSKILSLPDWQIIEAVGKVLEMRREQPQRNPPDLMQLMIDAEASDDHGPLEIAWTTTAIRRVTEIERSRHAAELAKKKLTTDEIKIQGLLFLVAGYDTTSTVLSYCAYALATNPEKQQLLFDEINQNIEFEENLTYEMVHALPYLDMVLRETLRMYSTGGLVINRRCVESCTINGLTIPEGMVIQANVWNIHYDPDIWGPTDPTVFEPERFTAERRAELHPLAWLPFGAGPRNCIGLRFALLQAKIVLAKLIKKFRIVPCQQTKVPIELEEKSTIISPKGGVTVELQLREL